MSREFTALDVNDNGELKSLFSWLEEAVPSEPRDKKLPGKQLEMSEFNGSPAVIKTIAGNEESIPNELMLHLSVTAIANKFELSESEAGVVKLRKVVNGDSSWAGTMGQCPVTLDRIFPEMHRLVQDKDDTLLALRQHVLFAVFSSLVRTLTTLDLVRIVHGDFKPQNMGLSPTEDPRFEGAQTAFDLGISRLQGETFTDGAFAGTFVGTLAYMSGESLSNVPAHPARDVFACGRIMEGLQQGREKTFDSGEGLGEANLHKHLYKLSEEYDRARDQERDRLLKKYGKIEDRDDVLSVNGKPLTLMEREGIKKEMELRAALLKCNNFIACLNLVESQMRCEFPEYRPGIALLKLAVAQLERLLPPLPAGSVSEFFQSIASPKAARPALFQSATPQLTTWCTVLKKKSEHLPLFKVAHCDVVPPLK